MITTNESYSVISSDERADVIDVRRYYSSVAMDGLT
jgi:hypothetical protein